MKFKHLKFNFFFHQPSVSISVSLVSNNVDELSGLNTTCILVFSC